MQCKQIPSYRGPICSRMMSEEELQREKKEHMSFVHAASFAQSRKLVKKVSTFYQNAMVVLKWMEKERVNLKDTLKNVEVKLLKTEKNIIIISSHYKKVIDYIIEKTKIMEDYPSTNIYTVVIFVGQLLWGEECLTIGRKETSHLLYYEADLKEGFLEASAIFHNTYQAKLPSYVRVNTLSISLEECISDFGKEGWNLLVTPKTYHDFLAVVSNLKEQEFIRDFHITELLVFPPGTNFYEHPGHLGGKFVLQDKGSCLASFLLNPKPGSGVYDMFAAPGKTTNHLACIVNNEANVYATDFHPHRCNRMQSFLQLTKSTCVETMLADARDVRIDNVNYVLLDIPSTYSGIFYKNQNEDMGKMLKSHFPASVKLLLHALQQFSTAKRIVYATCSIHAEEAEKVIQRVVPILGDSYTLLDVKELLWNQWINVGHAKSPSGLFPSASKCLRTIPEFDKCHGYFIAVFERNFDVYMPSVKRQGAFKHWGVLFDNIDEDKSDNKSLHDDSNKRKLAWEGSKGKKFRYNAPPDSQVPQASTSANQKLDSIWFE